MKFARNYAFAFFLLMPLVGGFVPDFKLGPLSVEGERLFLLGMVFCVIILFINRRFVLRISVPTIWLTVYYLYLFVNRLIQDTLVLPEVINFSLPILFMLYVDNINFQKEDYFRYTRILIVVGIASFIVSYIQLTIDPFFYSGGTQEAIEHISHYEVMPGVFRNNSLYRGLGANEGAIALGMLSTYILFQNFYKYKAKYLILTGLLFFSVFVVFAKYCWLMFFIAVFIFLYFKYPKSRLSFVIFGGIILFYVYFFLFDQIEKSTIYQNRIAAETYTGRTESTRIFFESFYMRKPVWGFGVSSWDFPEFMQLYYIGIHVGFLDILFRGGIIGLGLLFMFWYQIWRKSKIVFDHTGNPMFFSFVISYMIINTTAVFIPIAYYGYYIMLFGLGLYYNLYVKQGYEIPKSVPIIPGK